MRTRLLVTGLQRPLLEALRQDYAVPSRCLVKCFATASGRKRREKPLLDAKWKSSHPKRTDIINNSLTEDIVQRLSHVLGDERPSAILDLCPGIGLLSAKLNETLKPDLHVLIEPRKRRYGKFLEKLSTKKGVELYNESVNSSRSIYTIIWDELFAKYILNSDAVKGSKDVLVIINLTDENFRLASKVWSFLQKGLVLGSKPLRDWKFRFLGVMASNEAEAVIPRSIVERKKVALLDEVTTNKSMYIAETDNQENLSIRGYEIFAKSAAGAAQRTAENNIPIPKGRERPQVEPITELPAEIVSPGSPLSDPLYPSASLRKHINDVMEAEEARSEPLEYKDTKKLPKTLGRSRIDLRFVVRNLNELQEIAKGTINMDQLQSELEKARTDSNSDPEALSALDSRIRNMRTELAERIEGSTHFVTKRAISHIDQYRASTGSTNDIKNSMLAWDHRPFEPLLIQPDDIWPHEKPCAVLYMEPKTNDQIAESLSLDIAHQRLDEAVEISNSVLNSFGVRGREPVQDMLTKLYPGKSIVEVIKAVPSLFPYIPKQLASNTTDPANTTTETSSSKSSYYDSFEYLPQKLNFRCLPNHVMLDLLKYYLRTLPTASKSFLQVNRSLGGSATKYSLRTWILEDKR
ncbi:hypothetical protein BGW36DRAFT_430006 [Talaromyces proteolyticus]|uniref:rRNA adenine N(6)-methyltransferase n=1 Tax=Talaromyces proteolyticus TaxID=1131652 RepID=A0AAD4PTW7_9EURO|nr:uncharacterized protein BGW36DRAFT_430006 [Talaromyces proteolyticus]KAH8693983.1 hypothetical protein BGW36DRAFT_430006 [Talaromyces proteolyticus]